MSQVLLIVVFFSILIISVFTAIIVLVLHIRKLENKLISLKKEDSSHEKEIKTKQFELSEIKQKHMSSDECSRVMEFMDLGILVINMSKQITYINRYAEKILDGSRQDIVQKPYDEGLILKDKQGNRAYEQIKLAMKGNSIKLPRFLYLKTAQQSIPITGHVTPMKEGSNQIGVILSITDATEEANKEEDERAFLSTAAHELRSPLTSIEHAIALLVTDFESTPPEKVKELLVQSREYITQLKTFINDFLNVTRLTQRKLDIVKEPFDIISLTHDVIQKQKPSVDKKHIYIQHDSTNLPVNTVTGDDDKTREIITNLISNAIKYTHQGGITISHKAADGHIFTSITDTGIGIHERYHSLLFRKFQEIGSKEKPENVESTGLGLYIARELARLMGGDVILEKSEPGKGSTFVFTLPVAHTK